MSSNNGKNNGNGHHPESMTELIEAHQKDPTPDQPKRRAWDQIEGESPRAYEAFQVYLSFPLGERTVCKAWGKMYGREVEPGRKAPGYFGVWAAENRWRDRAEHWDNFQLMQGMAKRELLLERARQRLVDKSLEVVKVLVDIAVGKVTPKNTQVSAANSALSRAGLVEYSRVEHTGAYGGPIGISAEAPGRSERFAGMGQDDLLAQYREALEASGEGE